MVRLKNYTHAISIYFSHVTCVFCVLLCFLIQNPKPKTKSNIKAKSHKIPPKKTAVVTFTQKKNQKKLINSSKTHTHYTVSYA